MSRNNWGNERYDPRDAEPEERLVHQERRKSTRKWCKGKVGVEHEAEVVRHHAYVGGVFEGKDCHWWEIINYGSQWQCYHARQCTRCGKYVDMVLPTEDCPTWQETRPEQPPIRSR